MSDAWKTTHCSFLGITHISDAPLVNEGEILCAVTTHLISVFDFPFAKTAFLMMRLILFKDTKGIYYNKYDKPVCFLMRV